MLHNMTPHAITFILSDGSKKILPSEANWRIPTWMEEATDKTIEGIPVKVENFAEAPDFGGVLPQAGETYIVSRVFATEYRRSYDEQLGITLVAPSDYVRDEGGNIVGCKTLTFV